MRNFFRYFTWAILLIIVASVVFVAVTFPPIMAGMVAKTMCSCVYATGRTPESVAAEELQVFPGLSLADVKFTADSTVTARLFFHTSTAIYRKGLGCTLIAERSADEIKSQKINLPEPPPPIDSLVWPMGNHIPDTVLSGVNYTMVQQVVAESFQDVDSENPVFTHGVVVLYKGHLIAEKYAPGYTHTSRMMGWSMTKTITNALIGLLVKDGKLAVDEPAPVSEWQNNEGKSITLNHLLQASSGLQWNESYFSPTSDFHNMFTRSDDKGAYAAGLPLKRTPGTYFEYSSGSTNILSRIIRQQVGDENYYRFPYEKLFYKLGMNTVLLEPDASGTFVGSSYSYASARDWARFGLLYLQDGMWNGERILPEGWVKYSTTPGSAAPLRQYGAQIWLNYGNPNDTTQVEYPGLPNEAIILDGFEKNFVVLIPSKQLVIVRLGVTHNKNFSLANLVNGVVRAVE